MTIGENIKTIRKKKKITQTELSKITGISVQSIRKYEADKIIPKLNNLQSLAKALETTPSELDITLNTPLNNWNEIFNSKKLAPASKMYEIMISLYGEELSSSVNDFLENLNPEGQEKTSEYINLLMQKYKK